MKNILIIGCGFSGSVIARELAEHGYNVTIIDKRNHIAGNCYDYVNEHGILIHKYGPHAFHTNNKEVMDWLLKFGEWYDFKLKIKAQLSNGRYVTLPVNKETKEIVGEENLIETFVRPYTEKMWGVSLEEVDPNIIQRVPFRDDMNELYFPNDKYQMMPMGGYTKLFQNILNHKNITVKLNVNFDKSFEKEYDYIFNSMPIDEYFDFCYGELPYRSLKFHTVSLPINKVLPSHTVNFTNREPYTRMVEYKNWDNHGTNQNYTTLVYEEPCDYKQNNMERYYPVKDLDGKNRELYNEYKDLVKDNMQFIGRCGQYVYFDMHQAISSALATSKKFLNSNKKE
jgi:UDP-galactopyranose mutase